jgi:hypothetical protein
MILKKGGIPLSMCSSKQKKTKQQNLPLWSCLNSLHRFQPRFPFPSFHGGDQVNQPNDLAFAVFLQSSQTTDVSSFVSPQTHDINVRFSFDEFLLDETVPSERTRSPANSKPV